MVPEADGEVLLFGDDAEERDRREREKKRTFTTERDAPGPRSAQTRRRQGVKHTAKEAATLGREMYNENPDRQSGLWPRGARCVGPLRTPTFRQRGVTSALPLALARPPERNAPGRNLVFTWTPTLSEPRPFHAYCES